MFYLLSKQSLTLYGTEILLARIVFPYGVSTCPKRSQANGIFYPSLPNIVTKVVMWPFGHYFDYSVRTSFKP